MIAKYSDLKFLSRFNKLPIKKTQLVIAYHHGKEKFLEMQVLNQLLVVLLEFHQIHKLVHENSLQKSACVLRGMFKLSPFVDKPKNKSLVL